MGIDSKRDFTPPTIFLVLLCSWTWGISSKSLPCYNHHSSPAQLPLPLQYSCLDNPMKTMKKQKIRTLKDELSRSVGAQHVTGDQWRNNSRKNEEMESKQKQHPGVDVIGDESKVLRLRIYSGYVNYD